ncbi:MAG: PH domain-containing protein [Candidatus Saccharimonadales bacterium]
MLSLHKLESQLRKINFRKSGIWDSARVKELSKVLHEDEKVEQCVNGYYEGGFGMLAATNQRLILIDRKPLFFNVQTIWYDKISQVDFSRRLVNATIRVNSTNRDLTFNGWNYQQLHRVFTYSQEKINELKNGSSSNSTQASNAQTTQTQPNLAPQQFQAAQPVYFVPLPPAEYQNYSADNSQPNPVQVQNARQSVNYVPMNWPVSDADKLTAQRLANAKLPYSRRRYYAR